MKFFNWISRCHSRGYDISGLDAHKIWQDHSRYQAATWLPLPQCDDELFSIIYEAGQIAN